MRLSSRWTNWHCSRNFYFAVASALALVGFCFSAMADASHVIRYAPNPPYDNIPITPKTWKEVDLIYYSTISGHRYTNTIQLLRPIAWLHERHMDVIGGKVTLSIPEFGIVNVMATVKAIKPTQIDTRGVDWSKQKNAPVIGKFMRYVTDVRTYTFKDSLGHISHINATPNHPFYVKNKHGFLAIGNVSDKDTLLGAFGSGDNYIDGSVHLVCAKGKDTHCGGAFLSGGLPVVSVYNIEVCGRHVYRVGDGEVLVHNGCDVEVEDIFSDSLNIFKSRNEMREDAAIMIQNNWRNYISKYKYYDSIELRRIRTEDAYQLLDLNMHNIGKYKEGYSIDSIKGWFDTNNTSPTNRIEVGFIRSLKNGNVVSLNELRFNQFSEEFIKNYQIPEQPHPIWGYDTIAFQDIFNPNPLQRNAPRDYDSID